MKKWSEKLKTGLEKNTGAVRQWNDFFFPDYKAHAFFQAILENEPQIDQFGKYLTAKRSAVTGVYSEVFLVIALIFRSLFQINYEYVGQIISNPQNQILYTQFRSLSIKTNISRSHLNVIKLLFSEIKDEFIQFIIHLEEDYIAIQQQEVPAYYRATSLQKQEELVPGADRILELVPWLRYFPSAIFEWEENYSPFIMHKILTWSRLQKLDGCMEIRNALHTEISHSNTGFIYQGQLLGLIKKLPEKSKLYMFFKEIDRFVLEDSIAYGARFLLHYNNSEAIILTMDSTSLKAQLDDPDLSLGRTERRTKKRTHKLHVICDGLGSPLWLYRCPGELNDQVGFKFYKRPLLRLKKVAEAEGRTLKWIALDAGFASLENLKWIREKMKINPIPWPKNNRSSKMRHLISLLEDLRRVFRQIKKEKGDFSPEGLLKDSRYSLKVSQIEAYCTSLLPSKTAYCQFIAEYLLEIGIHNWFTIYRRRATIEGTFGILKTSYSLLRRSQDQAVPVKGKKNVYKHSAWVIHAMQINALYRILMLRDHIGQLKPSLAFGLTILELELGTEASAE
jgi:hypothetical protein